MERLPPHLVVNLRDTFRKQFGYSADIVLHTISGLHFQFLHILKVFRSLIDSVSLSFSPVFGSSSLSSAPYGTL